MALTTETSTRPDARVVPVPRRPDRIAGPVALNRPVDAAYVGFRAEPMTPVIGAEIIGLDLSRPLGAGLRSELNRALLDWKVIFFRDQHLTAEQHIAFAEQWGEIEVHPFIAKGSTDNIQRFEKNENSRGYENEWHTDNTWRELPSMGAILRAVEVPPVGGDTLFVDMAAAYDNLDAALRERIDDKLAEHDWMPSFGVGMDNERKAAMRERFPAVTHPVVRTHPETGRRTLFVNNNFTTRILGLDADESRAVLDLLYRQSDRPEYQCRFRWKPGSVAFWDNRAVQHYAASDYYPNRRLMERVAIVGDRPY
ncbi:MAG: TauD/TfdA dioxygenase family protein [Acidimicrobiia bacterium]